MIARFGCARIRYMPKDEGAVRGRSDWLLSASWRCAEEFFAQKSENW